ncbi:hypothetical protein CVT26_014692 [Gymnopilus dilepis]|uniref:F-box domain-containing protein n=1 Tax=Gymnopilus dilepis TaxID=231916 RepID=A0A409VWV5_9AGAR|nr:hypothetical protein CVT26_014692 [Gymnopilus dilepis]
MSSAASSSFPHMPLELVMSFFDFAAAQGDHDAYVDLLKSCSLVCRAWSTPAQKALFSQVTLRSQRSCELFLNAVDRSTVHGTVLGDAVKNLRVVLDHNQPSGLHHHSFALAVNACPNLSELEMSLYGCAEPGQDIVGSPDVSRLRRAAPSFDEQTLALLKSGPKIQHLRFDNWSENQQSIFQLLDIWPSLQSLSIGGTSPQLPQGTLPPFPARLRGLRLNFQANPSIDFLKWLLHHSTESLRVLNLDRDPSFDVFEYLVNTHGQTLQSFSFPGSGSQECLPLVSKCSHLKELRTENPACSPLLFKHLPKRLQRLGFGLERDTPLNPILDFVKSSDSLKNLDVQLWEGGSQHNLFDSLKIACVYRGTELTTTSNLRRFRTLDTIKN